MYCVRSHPVPREFELRNFNIKENFKNLCNIIQTDIYMFKVSDRNTETRLKTCSKPNDRQNNVPKLKTLH